MTRHASLGPERWGRFSLGQQILMIANEMRRASSLMAPADRSSQEKCYGRTLRPLDLTVATNEKPTLRRELLRWRDLVAALFVAETAEPHAHDEAQRCLLHFTPEASRQIPFL